MSVPHAVLGRAVILATLLAGSLPSAAAQAQATQTTTSETLPETDDRISCSGELVDIDGDLHLVFHRTDDAAGGFHGVLHENYQGVEGDTATGVDYRLVGATQDEIFNGREGGASEGTEPERTVRLIGQGSTDDTHLHVVLHRTANANGEPTADVMNVDVRCIG